MHVFLWNGFITRTRAAARISRQEPGSTAEISIRDVRTRTGEGLGKLLYTVQRVSPDILSNSSSNNTRIDKCYLVVRSYV